MSESSRQSHVEKTRKPYVAPKLIEYGAVSSLTASGSGTLTESLDGMSGNCMMDTSRMTC